MIEPKQKKQENRKLKVVKKVTEEVLLNLTENKTNKAPNRRGLIKKKLW